MVHIQTQAQYLHYLREFRESFRAILVFIIYNGEGDPPNFRGAHFPGPSRCVLLQAMFLACVQNMCSCISNEPKRRLGSLAMNRGTPARWAATRFIVVH